MYFLLWKFLRTIGVFTLLFRCGNAEKSNAISSFPFIPMRHNMCHSAPLTEIRKISYCFVSSNRKSTIVRFGVAHYRAPLFLLQKGRPLIFSPFFRKKIL